MYVMVTWQKMTVSVGLITGGERIYVGISIYSLVMGDRLFWQQQDKTNVAFRLRCFEIKPANAKGASVTRVSVNEVLLLEPRQFFRRT